MRICPISTVSTNKHAQNKKSQNLNTCKQYNVNFESRNRFLNPFVPGSIVKLCAPVVAVGAMSAVNTKTSDEVLPSREEFARILNSQPMYENPESNNFFTNSFLDGYDNNPEYALKFYNMRRSDGTLLRELRLGGYSTESLFNSSTVHVSEVGQEPDSREIAEEKYKFLQQLIDLKAPSGSYLFERAEDAINIMRLPFSTSSNKIDSKIVKEKIIEILTMKNLDGTPRFPVQQNLYGLERGLQFLVEKPEIAQKYIDLKDDKGNPRFGLYHIALIGQSYGYSPLDMDIPAIRDTETLDNLLSLKRNDGSYVYDCIPDSYDAKLYKQYPTEFIKLVNQKDDEGKYIESHFLKYTLLTLQMMSDYPDEYQKFIETYPYYLGMGIEPDNFKRIYDNIDKIKPLLEKKTKLSYCINAT